MESLNRASEVVDGAEATPRLRRSQLRMAVSGVLHPLASRAVPGAGEVVTEVAVDELHRQIRELH